MTIKAGIGDYVKIGFILGAPCGAIVAVKGFFDFGFLVGLLQGVACFVGVGAIFAVLAALSYAVLTKKARKKREEIKALRRVFCDGGAEMLSDNDDPVSGWLFFTEAGMEFCPNRRTDEELTVPLGDILSVDLYKKTGIVLHAKGDLTYAIQVSKNALWKQEIEKHI